MFSWHGGRCSADSGECVCLPGFTGANCQSGTSAYYDVTMTSFYLRLYSRVPPQYFRTHLPSSLQRNHRIGHVPWIASVSKNRMWLRHGVARLQLRRLVGCHGYSFHGYWKCREFITIWSWCLVERCEPSTNATENIQPHNCKRIQAYDITNKRYCDDD